MKHMLKIFLIAIVGLFVGNAEATTQAQQLAQPKTIFELPKNTPGLMKNKQNKTVCGQQKACVHVVIGNDRTYELVRAINENNSEVGFDAVADDYQVYFPVDGTQPTTPEAVEYSCANIDNRENSPITEWYMKMFGVIDENGGTSDNDDEYIKAGWNGDATAAQRIISFDASVDTTLVNDQNIPGARISRRALFEREFRKIASNPVGRVLLYRILIEIRRYSSLNHLIGICEDNQLLKTLSCGNINDIISNCPSFFGSRNKCRMLNVNWNDSSFNFIRTGGINVNNKTIDKQLVNGKFQNGSVLVYSKRSDLSDDLCHEFIHWYHWLRDPVRFVFDLNQDKDILFIDDANRIGHLYYAWLKAMPNRQKQLSTLAWANYLTNDLRVNFEEMRTILGSMRISGKIKYLEGDDLSENIFMLSRLYLQDLPLEIRFGHKEFWYVECGYSIENAMNAISIINQYIPGIRFSLKTAQPLQPYIPSYIRGDFDTLYPADIAKRFGLE